MLLSIQDLRVSFRMGKGQVAEAFQALLAAYPDRVARRRPRPPGGSTVRTQIEIGNSTGKNTCEAIDNSKAERWVFWNSGGREYPQMFQFTTPNEAAAEQRCGKVVFSDMHVSGDSDSSPGTPFPGDCASSALTPQEKALAFMFFDIASCVGPPIGKAAPAVTAPLASTLE